MKLILYVVLLVPCIVVQAQGNVDSCTPANVDTLDLANLGILQTSSLTNGITEEVVIKQFGSETLPKDYQTYFSATDKFQTLVESGEASVEFGEIRTNSGDDNEFIANQAFLYYKPLCPYRHYWLNKFKWFFIQQSGDVKKYCWPYYTIYITSCQTRYCRYGSWLPDWWPLKSRCVPIYRYVWIYSRCATVANGQVTWANEFIRRRLPRGCQCRSYKFPFTTEMACPVTVQ